MYSIYRDTDAKYVLFVTKNGLAKKTSLEEYVGTKKKTGIGAINIKDDDELAAVSLIKDENIALITKNGYVLKFNSSEVGATSRMTSGVKGINLSDGDQVVCALPIRNANDFLALFSEKGLAKKLSPNETVLQKRGGKGLQCYKVNDISGAVKAATLVSDEDNILIVGDKKSICVSAKDIPNLSRASQGNQMIKNGNVITVSKV
jgi:DNA gyrase subunit A